MKTIREILAGLTPVRRKNSASWAQLALMVVFGLAAIAASAQPANDNFTNATVLAGNSGSTSGDNTLATLETPCEARFINVLEPGDNPDLQTNSVWFAWTAPNTGTLEIDTAGSAFESILSVWTSTNASPTLCDGSLTNLIADDNGQGIYNSQVSLPVVAGTTYYISLASYDDTNLTSFVNAGAYVLNWNENAPTVPTGTFSFTSSGYVVSQSDSTPPINADGTTVGGYLGARITVTRPAPAYGRVMVDYSVLDLNYTNLYITNYYGTNIFTQIISTDIPPLITFSNSLSTNIVAITKIQQYNNGYYYTYLTNFFTNSATLIEGGVSYGTNTTGPSALSPLPANLPVVTNSSSTVTVNVPNFIDTFTTNIFGYLQNARTTRGTNYLDGQNYTNSSVVYTNYAVFYTNTFVTNFYGTNIYLSYQSTRFAGPYFSTNLLYTNTVVGLIYATNSIYTNGALSSISVLLTGTNWFTNSPPAADTTILVQSFLNASNYLNFVGAIVQTTPAPTNWPTTSVTFPPGFSSDSSSNLIITVTNDYAYSVTDSQIILSASQEGIPLSAGTLVFSNLQMSASAVLPVRTPTARYPVAGYGVVVLSNPRLDPQEDANVLIAPTIGSGVTTVNALSTSSLVGGVFNFERSTFYTSKNIGTATISVYRIGGNGADSCSVDYNIDPDYPNYSAISPNNPDDPLSILNLYDPANTFPLQAGSDYATPNSDFTPVSGTLTWGIGDFGPKQISIPILNNGAVEINQDFMVQLHNALPLPTPTDPGYFVGEVNQAFVTIRFDNTEVAGGQFPGQQPAGAVDRSWNNDNENSSDPAFNQTPGTTPGPGGTVYAVAEQPDGSAIIAGNFNAYNGYYYNGIVRALPNGAHDPNFQGNYTPWFNSGANGQISSVALQPDGKIIIGGNFTAFNGYDRHYIARLNTDGSLDTTFSPGHGANGRINALYLESNGQIIIAGDFTAYNTNNIVRVARLNSDGSLDTSFNTSSGPDGAVNAVAVDALGRIVIGGSFVTVSGVACGAVARLNLDGSLDSTFTPGIGTFNSDTLATDPVNAVAIQADGQILIGGSFAYYNLVSIDGLARLNTDGTLDLNFHPGIGTYNPVTGDADTVNSILIQPDNKILIGGNFVSYNETRRYGLARIFVDGSVDTSFMDATYNQFAGVPNFYFNSAVVSPTYPFYNNRNSVYALAIETNAINTSSNVIIGGSFEMVGGGFTRSDIRPRSNVARVIGGATPGPGNIALEQNNYSAVNNGGARYVQLVRTNGNLGAASALFSVTTAAPGPGVATPGVDFSPTFANPLWVNTWTPEPRTSWTTALGEYGPNYNEIPTLNPRNTLADVSINLFNPLNISGNLSANFVLSVPTGDFLAGGENIPNQVGLGAIASAPFNIIDSKINAGVLGFSSPVYTQLENGSSATITVTRTNGSTGGVTVFYASSDGTATNGVDYFGVTNSITLADGVTNGTFTILTKGHYTSIQPDKTVILRLFTPSGTATLGLTNAVLTLVNPNYTPGHLSFSTTNYVVNENAGSALITVNRLGGSTGTMKVTLQTVNGTATNGVNYTGMSTNLSWNSGDATPRYISIPVKDDGVVTPNLVANLQLINCLTNGVAAGAPLSFGGTNAALTIVNVDSAGAIQFTYPTYSVKKYAGYALVPIIRTGGSVGTVSVNVTTLDDTAISGTDYTTVTNTLVFTNGQVMQTIVVPVLPTTNGLVDLFVQLNTNGLSTLASLGNPAQSTLYIIDSTTVNEPPGSVDTTYSTFAGFNDNVYAIALQANNQLVVGGNFTMADGVIRNRIARLNSDGTLDAGFSLPSSSYGANDTVRAVAIQNDGRILMGGSFTNVNGEARGRVARLNADGTVDNLFNPGSGADNPVYAVAQSFVGGVSKVWVGGSFATVAGDTFNGIARLNSDGTPDTTFNVGGVGANNTVYAIAIQADGKVLIGGDFTAYNGVANFQHIARLNPDGTADTNFNVSVSGPNDSVRAIALQLDGKILIGGLFTNVDGVPLNHMARLNADGTVDSTFTAGLGANAAVFSINIQRDNRIVVGGSFTTWNGVSRGGITRLNFDGTVDPSINFGVGANGFVAAIAIQQDTIAGYPTNVPDEKLILGGGFTLFGNQTHQHLARIFGGSIGGSGAFQFSATNYVVDENGFSAIITVQRTGGTSNSPSGDVFVTASTSDGSAIAGINYSNTSVNLDFPLGEVQKTFVVPVIDDHVVTPDLTVNLALSNPTAPASLGNQPTSVLTILNDDSSISFTQPTYTVPKNTVSGSAGIGLARQGGTNSAITVTFIATNGTALPTTDYTPVTQSVVFPPGVTSVTAYVPINNNGLAEGNKTVLLSLTNVVNSTLVAPSNAVLTIQDTVTAPGSLYFAATNFAATSSDGVATLTVLRTNGTSGLVSATYYTVPGTALPGANYVTTTNTVTFNDGQISQTITVPLINNPTAQSAVNLTVNLSNPAGGATLVQPTNTTLTIFNTNAVFAFTLATNTVSEAAGTASVVIERFNNLNIVSSVNFATVDGTAVAGINYSNTAGLLTFGPGEIFKSIGIPLINRSNITDVAFGVSLSNPSNARLIAPSNTVVIIQPSGVGISFTTNATSVGKNANLVVIAVVCSNPGAEPAVTSNTTPLEVSYATVDGSARAGFDYNARNGTLVFTNGIGTNYIYIPLLSDPVFSSNLTFSVTLTNVTRPGFIAPYGTETVTIVETNSAFHFSQANYSVYKTAGFATINVTRTGFTDTVASVDFLVTNGTAVAGQNFYATNGTLIFTNGVTSQSFNVQLIASAQVQPNLYALMELMNPNNGLLISPAVATLTLLENGGSYVIPAGAQLVTSSSPTNLAYNVIGSNDTVQVQFAFRDAAGLNVTNLIAYLLATNGVTAPSPASQTYGPLTAYNHSVSRPFTFTAHGTNNLTISPTFQLYDNGKFIGPATFVFTVGAWTTTFANSNAIVLHDKSAASPYPSIITVTNVGNSLVKATVTLNNLSHQNLSDVDALVVSPTTNTLIMGHVGAGYKAAHLTLTFDDGATNSLPQNGTVVSGTNKPTQYYPIPNFP